MAADGAGRRLEGADGAALHLRIRAEIGERIRSGAWPPGYRLLVEHDLMQVWTTADPGRL